MDNWELAACAHNESRNSPLRQTCTGRLHFRRAVVEGIPVSFYICDSHLESTSEEEGR